MAHHHPDNEFFEQVYTPNERDSIRQGCPCDICYYTNTIRLKKVRVESYPPTSKHRLQTNIPAIGILSVWMDSEVSIMGKLAVAVYPPSLFCLSILKRVVEEMNTHNEGFSSNVYRAVQVDEGQAFRIKAVAGNVDVSGEEMYAKMNSIWSKIVFMTADKLYPHRLVVETCS